MSNDVSEPQTREPQAAEPQTCGVRPIDSRTAGHRDSGSMTAEQQPATANAPVPEPKDPACVAAYRAIRVLHILERRTGEGKGISIGGIIEELECPEVETTPPVRTGKKSLFTAISALRSAGYRIEYRRTSGYHLLSRSLPDEEIVRLLAIVDRNRTTPADIKRSMSRHLAALASADIIEHLDLGEEEAPAKPSPPKRVPRPTVDARELLERAIAQAVPVIFDIAPTGTVAGVTHERCALQPVDIRDRDDTAYVLGTVIQAQGAEDALRAVAVARMRNIECRLLDGSKLMAALDEDDDRTQAA